MFKKKIKAVNLVCAGLIIAFVGSSAIPAFAANHNFNFSFSFDYGNIERTTTEYKDTGHAVTMTCTGSDNLSSYNYTAWVHSDEGDITRGIGLSVGKTAVFYDVSNFAGKGVYIQASLNGSDVDAFWGTWNPDDPQY